MVADVISLPARRRNWTEKRVIRLEETEAWRRVQRLGQITGTSAIVGRPDWAEQAGAELVSLANRQLARLQENGNDVA